MPQPHLARTGLADLDGLVAQNLGAAGLMESNSVGHGSLRNLSRRTG